MSERHQRTPAHSALRFFSAVSHKGFSAVVAIILCLALIGAGAGYFLLSSKRPISTTQSAAPEDSPAATPVSKAISPDPHVPDNFILAPQFETADGPFEAGTAFVVKVPGQKRPVVLTAFHLFGPAGGMSKQVRADELPAFVKRANFYNIFENHEQVCTSDVVIPMPNAAPFDQPSVAGDIAAFLADENAHVPTVELALQGPKTGDTVYLAARASEGAPPELRLHKAVVTATTAQSFTFQYENQKIKVNGTNGAPVLNSAGQVAGINVAAIEDAQISGVAHPVDRFSSALNISIKETAFKLQNKPEPEATAVTATKTTAPAEQPPQIVMIGQNAILGKAGIQAEHFWEDTEGGEDTCPAVFIATLSNAGAEAAVLPQIEVTLVDGENRQFKPHKTKQGTTGVLNPLMRSRNFYAFNLPKQVPIQYAQFKSKEGVVRVQLAQRSQENTDLIASDDYAATLQEAMIFASPKMTVKIQYEKAKAALDEQAVDLEAGDKDFQKMEKALDKAKDAVDAAKVPLEKARKESEAALDRVKYIQANWDTLPQRSRQQQQSKAEQDLERAIRHAAAATDTVKEKEAIMTKLTKDLKEFEKTLKTRHTKYEAQEKVVQGLEQKLAQ